MSNLHKELARSHMQSPLTAKDAAKAEEIKKSIDGLEKQRDVLSAEEPYCSFASHKAKLAQDYVKAYRLFIASERKEGLPQLRRIVEDMEKVRREEEWDDDSITDALEEIKTSKEDEVHKLLSIPGVAERELDATLASFYRLSGKGGPDSAMLADLLRTNYLVFTAIDTAELKRQTALFMFEQLSYHPSSGYKLAELLKRIADAEDACREQELPVRREAVDFLTRHSATIRRPPSPPLLLEPTSVLRPNQHPHAALQNTAHGSNSLPPRHRRRPSNLRQGKRAESLSPDGTAERSLGQLSLRQRAIYKRGAGQLAY